MKDKLGKQYVGNPGDSALLATTTETWGSCISACKAFSECDWATWGTIDNQCKMYGGWHVSTANGDYDSFIVVRFPLCVCTRGDSARHGGGGGGGWWRRDGGPGGGGGGGGGGAPYGCAPTIHAAPPARADRTEPK